MDVRKEGVWIWGFTKKTSIARMPPPCGGKRAILFVSHCEKVDSIKGGAVLEG